MFVRGKYVSVDGMSTCFLALYWLCLFAASLHIVIDILAIKTGTRRTQELRIVKQNLHSTNAV